MRTTLTGMLAGLALCAAAFAQDTIPPQSNGTTPPDQTNSVSTPVAQSPTSGPRQIASGSVIPVELTKSIDSKKAKAGDEVEARVTQDLKAKNGEILAPKDTKVLGRVTSAQPRTKEQKESEVGIAFDRVLMKNGEDAHYPMSIQAIIAPTALNPNNYASAGGPSPTPMGGGPGDNGGRAGMGSATPPPTPGGAASSGEWPSSAQSGAQANQPITGNTQGVVGISNLKLSAPADAAQGSSVTSDKNNVKLESGTVLLLRVNQ